MYYALWDKALSYIKKKDRIYDLGCGPGQFALLAISRGYNLVRACDFSEVAVSMARENNERYADRFFVEDLRNSKPYEFKDFDVAVSFEVFEHIIEDLSILKNIDVGKRIIFSVPTYDYKFHVRYFPEFKDVLLRYENYIDIQDSKYIKHNEEGKYIILINGVRK
jgi:SAM-dependent methyltransferase